MKRLAAYLLSIGVAGLAGCASGPFEAPEPVTYIKAEQAKMHAALHWDTLAEYEANKILDGVNDKSKPIYVAQPPAGASPFKLGYHNMLMSHLADEGAVVVTKPMFGGVTAEYDVQVVLHQAKRRAVETKMIVQPGEVIITTKVLEGHLVLTSDTETFYFEHVDSGHYEDTVLALETTRNFPVVGQ
jgi:hypothetical protein